MGAGRRRRGARGAGRRGRPGGVASAGGEGGGDLTPGPPSLRRVGGASARRAGAGSRRGKRRGRLECVRVRIGEGRRRRRRGGSARVARGARAPPPPAPDPGPRRLFATARVAAGIRCGRGDAAGGEAQAPGAACREQESKSKASRTPPSFPNFAPCGGRRPAARRVPTAPPERGRKKRDGAGAGEEGARARAESPATSVKTWGRRSAGRRRRKRREGGSAREGSAEPKSNFSTRE